MASIIALLFPFAVLAQEHPVIPATPDAANFSKVVNYPMTSNSGLPDISIPLHEIEIGGMKLPIALNYHSGGFKVGEKSGSVGLGWNLSTDLQITRTINGADDFGQNGYASNNFISSFGVADLGSIGWFVPIESTTASQSYGLASGALDGKPDKFNYRLLNKSGSFYILSNGGTYSFLPVPYDNIKIAFNQDQFVITDVDGTIYYFSLPILPSNAPSLASVGREVTGDINFNGSVCSNCSITTWKCMKIVNPTSTDEIDFTYAPKSITTSTTSTDFAEYFNNPQPICNNIAFANSTVVTSSTTYSNLLSHTSFQSLSSPKYIEYKDGNGTFFNMIWRNPANGNQLQDKTFVYDYLNAPKRSSVYNLEGLELSSIQFRGGSVVFNGTDQLASITINNQGQEVKTIRFYQTFTAPGNLTVARSYNGSSFNGTLYLDSLSITNGTNKYETYGFQYKNKFCFGSHLKGHDAWGYINAKTMEIANDAATPPLYPPQSIFQNYLNTACTPDTVTVSLNGNGDEFPDANLIQKGMLSSISYPTGGHTDFDFEANRYSVAATDVDGPSKRLLLGGGLRIQKITYYDGVNLNTSVGMQYFTYGDLEDGEGILLNPPRLKNVDGSLIYGNYNLTQSVYYGTSATSLGTGGDGIMPGFVAPCTSNNCILLTAKEDKTTYLPNSALDLTYAGGSPIYYNKITEYQLDYGRQAGKTVYTYYPVDSFKNPISNSATLSGIIPGTDDHYLAENWYMGKLLSEAQYKYNYQSATFSMLHQKTYQYTSYWQPQWPRVIYCFLRNFFEISAGGSTTPQDYYLNTPYSTGSISPSSQNFILNQGGIPDGQLLISKQTEQWADDSSNLLTTTTQYYYDNSTYRQPSSIVTSDGTGSIWTHQLKYPYDYPGDTTYTAMVGRNILSPVVEEIVSHSSIPEFSHTQVNYAFTNNWFYAPSSRLTSFGGHPLELETQFSQYDNFGNLVESTGRDGITHSYLWGYTSRYPVAEVSGMGYNAAISGSGINQTVLDAPSSDAQLMTELNKLRTIPAIPGLPALVKSYTYLPMTGITSSTDPKGLTTFFEYDPLSRLTAVRDNSHNLIKQYQYSMAGPSAVPRFYTNKPVMVKYGDCYTDPSTGPGNNYIVPGGTHPSPTDYTTTDNALYENLISLAGMTTPSTTCANDTSNHAAVIALNTQIFLPGAGNSRPFGMKVEFLQNGSVVASEPFAMSDATFIYYYMPEGTYQISLMVDPSFRYKALKFNITPSNGPAFWAVSGDTITLQRKVTYEIQATNFF